MLQHPQANDLESKGRERWRNRKLLRSLKGNNVVYDHNLLPLFVSPGICIYDYHYFENF